MPLRFRAVVPYTLPGVLALIGWWWYISRKKQRLIGSPEGDPTTPGLRTSPLEGSNGLLEKATESQTNDTQSPSHTPPTVSNQRTEPENIAKVVQDSDAALLLHQGSKEAFAGRDKDEFHKPPVSALPLPDKEDDPQANDHKNSEQCSALALKVEDQLVKDADIVEEVILSYKSTKVSSSSPTTANLSNAERPEPEGEVAKHCSVVQTQDKMVVCTVTPAKVQRVAPSEGDSLETPLSAHDSRHHVLTSTPTYPTPASTIPTMVHDPTTRSEIPEAQQVHTGSEEDLDLELLACGLINKVISAATQEVLGVTSCQVIENSQPSCSSTPLASGRRGSRPEPNTEVKEHLLLMSPSQMGCESRVAAENGGEGIPNGCSLHSDRVCQTNGAQRVFRQTPSHQAAQSATLQNAKQKDDGATTLAEDSACSTCHSGDGISSEDLQSNVLNNKMDVIQVTDFSEREATQPLAETTTETTALTEAEENSVEAVCEIKRLNGMGLGNGALGTCEVETDQSGGKMLICLSCL